MPSAPQVLPVHALKGGDRITSPAIAGGRPVEVFDARQANHCSIVVRWYADAVTGDVRSTRFADDAVIQLDGPCPHCWPSSCGCSI